MQSTQYPALHVAIIMDGNGRWAMARGLPRVAGHREGAKAVRRTVEAAPGLGIGMLTLYAFSSDNWRRPRAEVDALMRLFEEHLQSETGRCIENGVRISVIGRRDRLGTRLASAIASAERSTARCTRLHLRVAVDYSARDLILQAAQRVQGRHDTTREMFARLLAEAEHSPGPVPEVDLLIRTAGEQRLSDFLLWESAYAELLFVPKFWPDFQTDDLAAAVNEFRNRERRFGALPVAAAG